MFVVVVGGVIMYFANAIADIFGSSSWAIKYFGGTRNAALTVGFVVMVIGFLVTFGIFSPSTTEI